MKATMDSAGRVVIPKSVRETAGLKPGSELQVEYRDGAIVIEPAPLKVNLVRKGSLLVAVAPRGTPRLTNEDVTKAIREVREERSRR